MAPSKNEIGGGQRGAAPSETKVKAVLALINGRQFDAAEAKAKELTRTYSHIGFLWMLLGISFDRQGKLDEAVAAFAKMTELEPNSFEAHDNLGQALHRAGRSQEAVPHFRRAVELKPDDAQAAAHLGIALMQTGRIREAVDVYARSMELAPPSAQAHSEFGAILLAAGRPDLARSHIETALEMSRQATPPGKPDPNMASAEYNLGYVLKTLGDLDGARKCYRRALELQHTQMQWFHQLALIETIDPADEMAKTARRLVQGKGSDANRAEAAFALARIHDRAGDHAQAASDLTIANKLIRNNIEFSLEKTASEHEAIKRHYRGLTFGSALETNDSSRPIFIVGMPRSGSSLLEQMLTAHSTIEGVGESRAFLDALAEHEIQDRMAKGGGAASVPDDVWKSVGDTYRREVSAGVAPAQFITDKQLSNYRNVGPILQALPDAKVIHAVRDPRDLALSIYQQKFLTSYQFAYATDEIRGFYHLYQDLMKFWKGLAGARIYELVHEQLVARPEAEIRSLLAWLGIPFEDQVLEFEKNKRPVLTASAAQVRSGLFTSSIGKWRPYADLLPDLFDGLAPEGSISD